jgi:hypothetical protein
MMEPNQGLVLIAYENKSVIVAIGYTSAKGSHCGGHRAGAVVGSGQT